MLLALWAYSLASAVGSCWSISEHQREFELTIRRHGSVSAKQCSFVALRPHHSRVELKGKSRGQPTVPAVGASWFADGEESAIFRPSDEDSLWAHVQSVCGGNLQLNCLTATQYSREVARSVSQEAMSLRQGVPMSGTSVAENLPLEILSLHSSGPPGNRANFVFFSDGYTPEEREKFIDDATRLAQDISGNQTFSTVKPLLNIWAAFSPSQESGIGTGGKPNQTPFGLYRDGTELRAVYYSKPEVAEEACKSMGDRCDYPILLGNDPFYGGLGGEFTVVTSSLANGPLVLRHELGHSIIDVGEEYDGGSEYYGVNSAKDLMSPLPWHHWLSLDLEVPPRIERSVMPLQTYPWALLNTSTAWTTNFTSSGSYFRHLIRFSLSGLPDRGDLRIELDGIELPWTPRDGIGMDRWHYDVYRDEALARGNHQIKFTMLNSEREDRAQLCSVEALEFGNAAEFTATPGYYGIFPTYSETNEVTYRPTNEDCLMRDVRKPTLCKVCTEGLWLSLLKQVDFIDDVLEGCQWTLDNNGGSWQKTLEVVLVPLAHLRKDSVPVPESYTIIWKKDGKLLTDFTNKTRIEIDDDISLGMYNIEVRFATEEVRVDNDGLLVTGGEFEVSNRCSRCNK